MIYAPNECPLIAEAKIFVGSNPITTEHVYFDSLSAINALSGHSFLSFFSADGEKLGEAKIIKRDGDIFLDDAYDGTF